MNSDLRRQLVSIFTDIFQAVIHPDVEDITAEEIASWDSFNKLRLVMELEQAFGISLSDEEVVNMDSLRRAEELLLKRGVAR